MSMTHALVATDHASRYLQQLCKHFAHKLETTFDPAEGLIVFGAGECRLKAGPEGLDLTVEAADPEAAANLAGVVDRHLLRFAFREDMVIAWQPVA